MRKKKECNESRNDCSCVCENEQQNLICVKDHLHWPVNANHLKVSANAETKRKEMHQIVVWPSGKSLFSNQLHFVRILHAPCISFRLAKLLACTKSFGDSIRFRKVHRFKLNTSKQTNDEQAQRSIQFNIQREYFNICVWRFVLFIAKYPHLETSLRKTLFGYVTVENRRNADGFSSFT